MVLNEKTLDEIFQYLQNSIKNLAKEAFENLEFGEMAQIEEFLQSQFDIRLENLLVAKKSSIHHLESGMKNKIIQRKESLIKEILEDYEV